jgi:catechol 2,3-dioxygenase-like lactoylglutathione lyase family enzyme
MAGTFPRLFQVVLDATDARGLAEFYRQLLGWQYQAGDEPPPPGAPDPSAADWLVLRDPAGRGRIGIQPVPALPPATWPTGPVPQQLHLDLMVDSKDELDQQHERVLALGATLLQDRSEHPQEPLRVYADPAGHPFCIFTWILPPGATADDI